MRGLGLGFTNPVGTWGVFDMCLCLDCGGVGGEWVGGFDQGLEGWGGVMPVRVWILYVDGRSTYLYIVLGGYMRILGAPSIQYCCTLSISGLFVAYIANPDSFVCGCRIWICLEITRLAKKKGKSGSHCWEQGFRHNLHISLPEPL